MFLHVKKKKKIPRTESKTFLAREKNIFKNVFTDPPQNLITLMCGTEWIFFSTQFHR